MRRVLVLVLAALWIGCGALAVSDYVNENLMFLSAERLTLQGVYGEHKLDVAKQKYVGGGEMGWPGFFYQNGEDYYGLYDPWRDIGVYTTVNDSKDKMIDHRAVHWPVGFACGHEDEVEALYQIERIYSYYQNLGWASPTGDGSCPIEIYTNVHYAEEDANFIDNAGAAYYPEEHLARVYVGEGEKTLGFDVLAHEYTHSVLHAHGVEYKGPYTENGAIHEGYADVMGVCAAGSDWALGDWRELAGGGQPKNVYHMSDYKAGETECHAGGMIIGHAAYLMAEELEGKALTKLQIAKVFLKSMEDLKSDSTLRDAGRAILKAAKELNKTKDESKDFILSKEQVNRVRQALLAVGLLDEEAAGDPEPTAEPVDVDAVLKKGLKALKKKYGTPKTGQFKGAKVRSAEELNGIIAAKCKDFDGDGTPELLVWRLENRSTDVLLVHMEMYEETGGQCARAASRTLLLPGLVNPNGRAGSSATGFIYKYSGRWCVGLDTYFGFNEDTVTVALYAYSEKKGFKYLGGACHEAWGTGTIEVRQAEKEPGERYALFGASWFSRLDDVKTPWKTVKYYDVEEHDWKAPGEERRKKLYKAFRQIIEDKGLRSSGDRRILPPAAPTDFSKYGGWRQKNILQAPEDIYGNTKGFKAQWRVASWERDGKSRMLVEGD